MAYKLPPLQFGYDALEPYIDAETMELHHDKHHQAYVDQLNKALEAYPKLADLTIDGLLRRLDQVPETIRTAVRNNGGGHANHQFFWRILGPNAGGSPKGAIADAITKDFGSFERFQSLFTDAAVKHFGSGWAFLVVNPATDRLEIMSLPNQDSVLSPGLPGLLCCDVWEHAYYLKYRNRRPDYLAAWWHVVAWDVVNERLRDARAGASHI
jgi:Fe-Mn family superoxide dismutase